MDALVTVSGLVSAIAALGALTFAWLTVREARGARREEAERREFERLLHLLDLAGAVGEMSSLMDYAPFGVAQLRLATAVAAFPGLEKCRELAESDQEHAFEVFLDARDELEVAIATRRAQT